MNSHDNSDQLDPESAIERSVIHDVCRRLDSGKPVRLNLPGGGRLNIDG